jgi:acyl-CoA thioesterase FadM
MNLVLRFVWMMIRAHLARRKTDVLAESRLTFRCLPHDLDVNWHMTNSRYASFMDIARIDHMIRSGAWARLRAARLFPVLGSLSIRFRRPVNLLQRFEVTTQVAAWDERWLYIEQKIVIGDETAAIAVCKTLFVGKQGRVPTDELLRVMGYEGPRPTFAELHAAKDALDKLLVA